MHRSKPLTSTHEMYLKVLHEVGGERGVARVTDLARGLGVSPATVSSGLKRLEELHLIEHAKYGYVALTAQGAGVAGCVQQRFDTIRSLLTDVLGVDPEEAALDACMMEHAVSQNTVDRMRALVEKVRGTRVRIGPLTRRFRTDLCANCKPSGACGASGGGLHQ